MTKTRYGVCDKCNLITYKKELTSTAGVTESISYRIDKTHDCSKEENENNTEVKLEVK